ncbi:MAG: hypothetical protein KDB29_06605 [Planctomycetes bacterium]|nr:hypothetical protein [Planctomycetota bacterium]
MLRTFILSAMLALLAVPAFAQDDGALKVGDDVAEFTPRDWINQPTFQSFSELKGDVILLKAWGIN